MKSIYMKLSYLFATILVAITFAACIDDLNTTPIDKDEITTEKVYSDPDNYQSIIAKIYDGYALTGNRGPAGLPDVKILDEGTSNLVRLYWNLQELTTDEAICAWTDPGVPDLHNQTWSSENAIIQGLYYRLFWEIAQCNEFIRQTTQDKLTSRGIDPSRWPEINGYREEARFFRVLTYWIALDLYGNVPLIDENQPIGSSFMPAQTKRADLYNWIETEALDVESKLKAPRANGYGRIDKSAVWMLLAKLYLNSEVYVAKAKYNECATWANKVITATVLGLSDTDVSGATYNPYQYLFLADNQMSPAKEEIIYPVAYHGVLTETYGGMKFLICSALSSDMGQVENFGISEQWGGNRSTSALPAKFGILAEGDLENCKDGRALFFDQGRTLEIVSPTVFVQGYSVTKYRNKTKMNEPGSNEQLPDTDYPFFRVADAYLMYAEAVLRGATTGSRATALSLINDLRTRAYGDTSGNIADADLTLDFILDERSRELFWECSRRTDLIRFGRFSTSEYLWPWKGGTMQGVSTPQYLDLFPIPASEIIANTNMVQNPGY